MQAVEVLLVEDNAGDAVLVGQVLNECPVPVHLHVACDGELAMSMLADAQFKPNLMYGNHNNGNVQSQTITRGSQTFSQTYQYDAVNRLHSAAETMNGSQTWLLQYMYDNWGNRALLVPPSNDARGGCRCSSMR